MFRSRDVVFFEDQTFEDQTFEDLKKNAPNMTSTEGLAYCDPVNPSVYQGNGGDAYEDGVEPDVDLPAGYIKQEEVGEQFP